MQDLYTVRGTPPCRLSHLQLAVYIVIAVLLLDRFSNSVFVRADTNFKWDGAESPLAPFMQPFVKLFDAYSTDAAASKILAAENDTRTSGSTTNSSLSTSLTTLPPAISMFDAETFIRRILGVTTTTTTTTATPHPSDLLVQTIFEPIIDSIEKEIRKAKAAKTEALGITRDGVKTFVKKTPNTLFNSDYNVGASHGILAGAKRSAMNDVDFPRRAPMATALSPASSLSSLRDSLLMKRMLADSVDDKAFVENPKISQMETGLSEQLEIPESKRVKQQPKLEAQEEPSPLASLLRFMGVDARPRADEVQVGRDHSVSVLGMPIGKRDGLQLSPLTGVSLGNQEMFGPVAVNDRYNVKWDFLDQFRTAFEPTQHRYSYRT